MHHLRQRLFAILTLACLLTVPPAALAQGTQGTPAPRYQADIVWTEYGIPHVTAADWGGLGYGFGYAFAQHNYCVVMKEFVRAAGESARYLGAEGDFNQDLIMKLFNDEARIREIFVEGLPDYLVTLASGYVAGLNRYLRETGVDGLAEGEEGCRGAEWVREVDVIDFGRLAHKRLLRGSSSALAPVIAAAKPNDDSAMWQPGTQPAEYPDNWPGSPSGNPKSSPLKNIATQQHPQSVAPLADRHVPQTDRYAALSQLTPATARQRLGLPVPAALGSNAYAVGSAATHSAITNGSGLLFGNPHFPWQGADRFYMAHLTIPGTYEVMGATLVRLPPHHHRL